MSVYHPHLLRRRDADIRRLTQRNRRLCLAHLPQQRFTTVITEEAMGPREEMRRFIEGGRMDWLVVGGGGGRVIGGVSGVAGWAAQQARCNVIIVR